MRCVCVCVCVHIQVDRFDSNSKFSIFFPSLSLSLSLFLFLLVVAFTLNFPAWTTTENAQWKTRPQNQWRCAGADSNRRRRWRSTRGRTRTSVPSTAPTATRGSASSRIWSSTWGYTRTNDPTAAPTAIRYSLPPPSAALRVCVSLPPNPPPRSDPGSFKSRQIVSADPKTPHPSLPFPPFKNLGDNPSGMRKRMWRSLLPANGNWKERTKIDNLEERNKRKKRE